MRKCAMVIPSTRRHLIVLLIDLYFVHAPIVALRLTSTIVTAKCAILELMGREHGTPSIRPLRRRDLPSDTIKLARFLVGKMLVHDLRGQRTSGRIVETEAYPVGDAAGHAFGGKTKRNASLYLARGHAYVYFVYGMYYCMNVSSERAGVGAGVLIRALEPIDGIDHMKERRKLFVTARSRARPRTSHARDGDRFAL